MQPDSMQPPVTSPEAQPYFNAVELLPDFRCANIKAATLKILELAAGPRSEVSFACSRRRQLPLIGPLHFTSCVACCRR